MGLQMNTKDNDKTQTLDCISLLPNLWTILKVLQLCEWEVTYLLKFQNIRPKPLRVENKQQKGPLENWISDCISLSSPFSIIFTELCLCDRKEKCFENNKDHGATYSYKNIYQEGCIPVYAAKCLVCILPLRSHRKAMWDC